MLNLGLSAIQMFILYLQQILALYIKYQKKAFNIHNTISSLVILKILLANSR